MRHAFLVTSAFAAVTCLAACDRSGDKVPASGGAVDTTIAVEAVQTSAAPAPKAPESAGSNADQSSVEVRYSPTYDACMSSGEAAQGVTVAMANCTSAEIEVQDTRLNAVYQQVMRGLEQGPREKLREAQRAWIKFRDTKCASESQSGGTMDILNGGGCILNATVRRTVELEAMAEANE